MTQQLIESLQRKAATAPRTPVWASPRLQTRMLDLVPESAVFQRARRAGGGGNIPQPVADGKNPNFARLYTLLESIALPPNGMYFEDGPHILDPIFYLNQSVPGRKLLDWLVSNGSNPANLAIWTITETHNENPGDPVQDVAIRNNPVHAWLALRDPIIERLVAKHSFAGLFQKQERILARLGTIWDRTINRGPQMGEVAQFNSMLNDHIAAINGGGCNYPSVHLGYLADTFFRYEILLRFCSSYSERTGLGTSLEKKNPALKLFRLILSKAVLTRA